MKRFYLIYRRIKLNNKAQATTELAIFGAIVIMLLGYLVSQGFIYNSRQALEMYTFRKALELSRNQEKGVDLTVMRDVFTPSFFSALSRQRIQASASVEYNPWKVYIPDVATDISKRQLLQINQAMIDKDLYFEIPPTKMVLKGEDRWSTSSIKELDAQVPVNQPSSKPGRESEYIYTTLINEGEEGKSVTKTLATTDKIEIPITFNRSPQEINKIIDDTIADDWEGEYEGNRDNVKVDEATIPKDITIKLEEKVSKEKTVTTPHKR